MAMAVADGYANYQSSIRHSKRDSKATFYCKDSDLRKPVYRTLVSTNRFQSPISRQDTTEMVILHLLVNWKLHIISGYVVCLLYVNIKFFVNSKSI